MHVCVMARTAISASGREGKGKGEEVLIKALGGRAWEGRARRSRRKGKLRIKFEGPPTTKEGRGRGKLRPLAAPPPPPPKSPTGYHSLLLIPHSKTALLLSSQVREGPGPPPNAGQAREEGVEKRSPDTGREDWRKGKLGRKGRRANVREPPPLLAAALIHIVRVIDPDTGAPSFPFQDRKAANLGLAPLTLPSPPQFPKIDARAFSAAPNLQLPLQPPPYCSRFPAICMPHALNNAIY